MIPYNDIRKLLVQSLSEYTGLQVIHMNGGGSIPQTAFLTYHFEPSFERVRGFPVEIHSGDHIEQIETVEFTVSFLSYADDPPTSMNNALRAREWFKTDGHDILKDAFWIIVHEIGRVENRDIAVEAEWERRHGFEVVFRMPEVSRSKLYPIEKVNIEGAGTIVSN